MRIYWILDYCIGRTVIWIMKEKIIAGTHDLGEVFVEFYTNCEDKVNGMVIES